MSPARLAAIHELKTHPEPFAAVWDGKKFHEVRINDRDFHVGDLLVLREYVPCCSSARCEGSGKLGNREIRARVTHITTGYGLPSNLVVMSIRVISKVLR